MRRLSLLVISLTVAGPAAALQPVGGFLYELQQWLAKNRAPVYSSPQPAAHKAVAAAKHAKPGKPAPVSKKTAAAAAAATLAAQAVAANTANSRVVASYAYPTPPGDNWPYSNSDAPGSTPTTIRPDGVFDVVVPASVGDTVRYEYSGRVNTPAGSGLTLSVWSIGGGVVRDWSSGTVGLKAVSGLATIPSGNNSSVNAQVGNTVTAGDLDANGMLTLRMYAANTGNPAGQSYLFLDYSGSGVISQARAVNLKDQSAASQPTVYATYPAGHNPADLSFQTTTPAYSRPVPVNPGSSDLVVPAQVLDIIDYRLYGSVNAASGLRFSVWSIGGSLPRCWSDGTLGLVNNSGIFETWPGTGKPIDAAFANRVLPSDLDSNGKVTLRLYVVNFTGSGLQQDTFLATDGKGNASYMQAVNYGNSERYVLTDSQPWEGPAGSSYNSEQEPSVWVDAKGMLNMLYTGGDSNHTGWATAASPAGPWTKYAGNPVIGGGALVAGAAMRNSVLYQNGTLYVYFAQENGVLYVATGADPAHLTLAQEPVLVAQGSLQTLENSAVVQGPGGVYYLFYEGLYGSTGLWQLGVATAATPLGPFTPLAGGFPLTSLQVADGSATDGPWVEWTGSKFRMVYHASPQANNNVPSEIYTAESTDGINWQWPSVNVDGRPTPIRKPYGELGHDQAADPFVLRYQGNVYLYHTEQAGDVSNGGIVVNDPTLLSNSLAY